MLTSLCLFALVIPLVLGAPSKDTSNIWAVLVAGSNGWDNYRHQADVCHAYQVFRRHGVPDSQIIVMMYDDIAKNDENPNKGVIINKPKGTNVYKHVPKDYTGDAVSVKNFVHVLTGNKSALVGAGSGKVLASGPNDHVFINFVDHGASGLVAFPNEYLYADKLISTLKTMHKKKMYNQLVFYMEACEAGSMFEGLLPTGIDIYVTTAANADESSYGCYCYNSLDTCLGDLYSVTWMNDIDSEDKKETFSVETLESQYQVVMRKIKKSHVTQYGDLSFTSEDLSKVFGFESSTSNGQLDSDDDLTPDVVSSRHVAVHNLKSKIRHTDDVNKKKELQEKLDALMKGRKAVDDLFHKFLASVPSVKSSQLKTLQETHTSLNMDMFSCYKTLVDNFNVKCVNINKNTYALVHLYKLANLCNLDNFSPEEVLEIYDSECTDSHRAMTGVN